MNPLVLHEDTVWCHPENDKKIMVSYLLVLGQTSPIQSTHWPTNQPVTCYQWATSKIKSLLIGSKSVERLF